MNEKTSESRKESSRKNGLKGGVKTEEGKAISSRNSLKHGMLSNVLDGYDEINAKTLFRILADEFKTDTYYQKILLEQLVLCYIKLIRCGKYETGILNETLHSTENPLNNIFPDQFITEGQKAIINEATFKRLELVLTRYEPQLVSRMLKLIDALTKMKSKL